MTPDRGHQVGEMITALVRDRKISQALQGIPLNGRGPYLCRPLSGGEASTVWEIPRHGAGLSLTQTAQNQAHQALAALAAWVPAGTVPPPSLQGKESAQRPAPSPSPPLSAVSGPKVHSAAPPRVKGVGAWASRPLGLLPRLALPHPAALTRVPASPPRPRPLSAPTGLLELGMNGMFPGPREGVQAGGDGARGRGRSPGHPGSSQQWSAAAWAAVGGRVDRPTWTQGAQGSSAGL